MNQINLRQSKSNNRSKQIRIKRHILLVSVLFCNSFIIEFTFVTVDMLE